MLEHLLAFAHCFVGILQINGGMDNNLRNVFICLFTNAVKMINFNPRVLVATTAANTGIDQSQLKAVVCVCFSCCILGQYTTAKNGEFIQCIHGLESVHKVTSFGPASTKGRTQ